MKWNIFLSIFCIIAMTSCLKKMDLSQDDLGPAVDPIELTKALGTGFGTFDYNEIKKDEFTSVLYSQRIQDSVNQNIQQEGITVDAITNDSEKLALDVIVQKEEYSGGQTSQSTVKWPLIFKKGSAKSNSVEIQDNARPPVLTFLTFQSLAFGSCYDEGDFPESCHKLTSTDIQYKVPPADITQHNCVDPNECYIPAKKVEFDMISKYALDKDGKPLRTHYTLVLSPHVPFLSRVLKICTRGIYEMSSANQKILADICYTVNNYKFAPSTP